MKKGGAFCGRLLLSSVKKPEKEWVRRTWQHAATERKPGDEAGEGLWVGRGSEPAWISSKVAQLRGESIARFGDGDVVGGGGKKSAADSRWSRLCEKGQLDEAVEELDEMGEKGEFVSRDMLYQVLKRCVERRDVVVGRKVHMLAVRSGYEFNVYLGSHVIRMYGSGGMLVEAMQVFRKLRAPDVFAWASIIRVHVDKGFAEEAMELYEEMKGKRALGNEYVYLPVLQACGSVRDGVRGRRVHMDVREAGLEGNRVVGPALVEMYAKCGEMEEVVEVYGRMEVEGVVADKVTFVNVMKGCGRLGRLEEGKRIHGGIRGIGLEGDVVVGTAVVDMYVKCGSLDDASRVFERLPLRNVVTWTVMMAGYAREGFGREAIRLFHRMEAAGGGGGGGDDVVPDGVTLATLLKACGSVGALQEGKRLHARIVDTGRLLEEDAVIRSALVDMYAKCGSLEEARGVFDSLSVKDVVTWTALIHGYAQHQEASMALECFRQMLRAGVRPDAATFTALLVACSHMGLVHAGRHYFDMMLADASVVPSLQHYTCMVDLLARAGHLMEAHHFLLHSMPCSFSSSPAAAVAWMALLTACKAHRDIHLASICFHHLRRLQPRHSAAYVIMSHMYARAGMWEEADRVEKMRIDADADKMAATAFVEVGNKVHQFIVGEHRDDVALKMKSLNLHLSSRDDDALCGHAEKIALAYALLNTPPAQTLRITKNLRMCNHCHDGTKIISRIEKREIIVRDAHRVHHFKDGLCSCADRH